MVREGAAKGRDSLPRVPHAVGAHAMPREEEDLAAISTFCRAALCGRAALGGGEVGAASAGQAGASPPRVVPVCCE